MEEELQDRLDSRRSSVKDLRRQKKDELILSVANLEQNFDKVKSYEAAALFVPSFVLFLLLLFTLFS